jgi:hypothetical protein
MDNKKIPTCLGTAILVVIAITAGAFVWVYEKNQQSDTDQIQIVSKIKNNLTAQTLTKNSNKDTNVVVDDPFKDLNISAFDKWKSYKSSDFGISIQYPPEFYPREESGKITFDFFSKENPHQKEEGSVLAELWITKEEKPVQDILAKRNINELHSAKQEKVVISGVTATKLSYRDTFAGGMFYEFYIPKKSTTIKIWYSGDNPLELTFEKMVSTIK